MVGTSLTETSEAASSLSCPDGVLKEWGSVFGLIVRILLDGWTWIVLDSPRVYGRTTLSSRLSLSLSRIVDRGS